MFKFIPILLLTGSLCAHAGTHGGGVFVTSMSTDDFNVVREEVYTCYKFPYSEITEAQEEFTLNLKKNYAARISFIGIPDLEINFSYRWYGQEETYRSDVVYLNDSGHSLEHELYVIREKPKANYIDWVKGRNIALYINIYSSRTDPAGALYLCDLQK